MGDTDLERKKKIMVDEFIRKQDAVDMCGGYGCLAHLMSTIKPADVVQVVRCRGCLHFDSDSHFCFLIKGYMRYDDFCSYGKTK